LTNQYQIAIFASTATPIQNLISDFSVKFLTTFETKSNKS